MAIVAPMLDPVFLIPYICLCSGKDTAQGHAIWQCVCFCSAIILKQMSFNVCVAIILVQYTRIESTDIRFEQMALCLPSTRVNTCSSDVSSVCFVL